MGKNVYLIDANTFLTPSKFYYRFSIAPGYWEQFNLFAKKGYIKTIDKIEKELRTWDKENLKDDIQLWYENNFKGEILSTKKQHIVDEYVNVIRFLNESKKYNEKAFLEWASREDVADPWLIATAKVSGYIVVTLENRIHYNNGTPMGSAKIPNVCEDLSVDYIDLFTMMEQLGISL